MSAAGRQEVRQLEEEEPSHDLAAGHDVTAKESEERGEEDGGAQTVKRRAQAQEDDGSTGSRVSAQTSITPLPARPSPDPSLAPSLAAWDTRTSQPRPSSQPTDELSSAPSDFRPFFTLIESPAVNFHHPTVHYIFSDDEDHESILTSAALNAITQQDGDENTARGGEAEERVILLDLQADGRRVAGVKSLSGAWQGLHAEVGRAPSWGGGGDGGLMVRIQDREGDAEDDGQGEARGLEGLVERFARGLSGLDEVLGAEDDEEREETR